MREPAILAMAMVSMQGIPRAVVDDIAAGFDDEVYGEYLVLQVTRTLDATYAQVLEAARRNAPEKMEEVMAALADRVRAEGKAEGETEGKAETLMLLLKRKFGTIPEARLDQI